MKNQPDYIGEDGLKRNLVKLKHEENRIQKALKETATKRLKEKPSLHNATNWLVEAARISAYYVGHVAAISIGLNVILVAALVAVLV